MMGGSWAGQVGTGDEFFAFLKDAFDMLREEGGRMMSVGMHMRLLGHPARAAGLKRFLIMRAGMTMFGSRGGWISRSIGRGQFLFTRRTICKPLHSGGVL